MTARIYSFRTPVDAERRRQRQVVLRAAGIAAVLAGVLIAVVVNV